MRGPGGVDLRHRRDLSIDRERGSEDMADSENIILSMEHITKLYPGVKALQDVSVSFRRGEVHALMGENGAGKSTLIKAIAGAIAPTEGKIVIDGEAYSEMTPTLSRGLGIEVVYQEFNLVEPLTVGENVCIGMRKGRLFDRKWIYATASGIFEQFQIDIKPQSLVRDLPSAQQQIVEIAKAICKHPRILILDEPTAPLTVAETEHLFEIVEKLKSQGITILYISHRLDEVFRISDRISILRDGEYITTLETARTDRNELISLMVGRELSETYPQRTHEIGAVALRAEHISTDVVKDISFEVHKGEILGVSGLVGAGRTELIRAVFGADKRRAGDIYVYGKKVRIASPKDAIGQRIGLIPEDRKHEGVFLEQSVLWNTSIVNIRALSRWGVVDKKKETRIASEFREALGIRTPSLKQEVKNLSGGNQQKVVIAKTLAAQSDIVFFDEPTRGIDVGARHEIYLLMNRMAAEGKSIVMITSDMEELLGMSDRIIVLCEGKLMGELHKGEFSQDRVLRLASGIA